MSAVDISTLGIAVESSGVETASNRLNRLSQEGGKAEAATSKLSSSFDGLSRYATLAAEAFAAWKLAELIKDVTILAARYETLGVVMRVVGNNAGYTGAQMAEFQKGLQKTGISAVEARQGLVLMGQAHVDMAKSAQLARVAQDAAVIANTNSSEAFNRMMTGISTGQAIILHHMGLMVNFEKAYQNAAAALGKAKEEMTEQELTQARVNEVMKVSVGIAGSYEAAMGTTGKALNSLKRFIDDAKVAFGELFTPALGVVVDELTLSLKSLGNWFKDNKSSITEWGNGFKDTLITIAAEVARLSMLLDKAGGSMTSAGMLLFGPGAAMGNANSKAQFEKLAAMNMEFEARYKEGEALLQKLAGKMSGNGGGSTGTDSAEQARIAEGNKRRAEEAAEARKNAAEKAEADARELAEKQSRYNQQVLEAEATLRAQYASNQKQREDSALQQRLEALNTEKATGLKTAEEYLNAKYDLEREYMQKDLDASNALLEQRYQDYSKISNDPAADRLQQAKAEEAYQKQLGESLKIVEKMNAANREKSHDNEALAQQRINEEVRRANDLYNEQLRVRQQLVRMDNETRMNAANMTGVNPSTGGIDTVADAVAHDLAVQQAAHEQKLQMIDEERDANVEALMEGRRAYEDFVKTRQSLDKLAAQENQDHSNKNAAIALKGYKSQLYEASKYTTLASQLFGALTEAQDQSSRKGFENAKMFATASAIMNTAAAIMNALATVQPYPLAVATAAVAAATGAIQIANIQSTTFGGGGTAPTVSAGSFGGSGGTGTAGAGIGAPVKSVAELQSEESLTKMAQAADSASLAMTKVADGLTKISQLFESSYSVNFGKGLTSAEADAGNGTTWDSMADALKGKNAFTLQGLYDPGSTVQATLRMFGIGNDWYTKDRGIALGMDQGENSTRYYSERRKDGGWFGSAKTKYEYSEADPQLQSAFGSYASQIKTAVLNAALSMGTTVDFSKANLATQNISTAGRKPEDIQKDLEKFFTDAADTLAKTTKGLEKFAFFGENAFDALIRLSTSLQGVNELFELTGKTLVSSTLEGANAAYKLADAFGGLDKMQDSVGEYFKAMFSESEQDALKAAQNQREINTAFKTMGLAVPKTTEEFIKLVNSLDITKEKGAALYKALMDIAPEFADFKKYLEDLSNTAIDDAYAVLQKSVQTEKETLQKWYSAHSEHLDKLWAKSQEAYKKEEDAARTRLNKVQGAANSIKSAYDGLTAPDAESLMSREYAERMIRAYADSNRLPLNGELDKAMKAVSQPSQNLFSSDVDYRRDFYRTASDLATLNKRAQGQLSDAEKQLQQLQQTNDLAKKAYDDQKKAAKAAYDAQIAALDKTLAKAEEQIKAIRGTTVAVMSVDKALANLTAVIAKQTVATGGDKAAVNELKELRAELRAQNGAMAKYMLKMSKYIEQWEDEGMPATRTA